MRNGLYWTTFNFLLWILCSWISVFQFRERRALKKLFPWRTPAQVIVLKREFYVVQKADRARDLKWRIWRYFDC
jgi:hypothetical protein